MTDDSPIPLARPVLGEEEEAGVLDVLRSGRLSLGPRVPEFETAFAGWLGAAHASAVSSGTAGLHLALRAVGVSDGAEVVTSPFSFVASANVMVYERAGGSVWLSGRIPITVARPRRTHTGFLAPHACPRILRDRASARQDTSGHRGTLGPGAAG